MSEGDTKEYRRENGGLSYKFIAQGLLSFLALIIIGVFGWTFSAVISLQNDMSSVKTQLLNIQSELHSDERARMFFKDPSMAYLQTNKVSYIEQ